MTGQIVQINISRGGVPKRPIPEGVITPVGIEGDLCAHPQIHGGPKQAILLMAAEVIDELIAGGYPLYYGALGENLTTRGLDRTQLRIGQTLRAGTALIEITKLRAPCLTLDIYGPTLKQELYDMKVKAGDHTSPRWGKGGFYARVIEPGRVRESDAIMVESTLA